MKDDVVKFRKDADTAAASVGMFIGAVVATGIVLALIIGGLYLTQNLNYESFIFWTVIVSLFLTVRANGRFLVFKGPGED